MIKVILKAAILPILLILSVTNLILNTGIKVYCFVSAVALKMIVICALVAACTGQWPVLITIGAMIAIGIMIAYGTGFIVSQIERYIDSMKDYFRA